MRIVYLHQYFNTPEMSGGSRPYEFARRFVEAGHDVHVITSDRKRSGKPYDTIEAGARVTWIPVPYANTMGPLSRLRAFLTFAIKAARVAARSEADVVLASSTPLTTVLPGVYAKWRQKAPMVFEVRDPWPEVLIGMGAIRNPVLRWLAWRLQGFAHRNADHIVALSVGMKEIVAGTGYPERKITVITNASDMDRFDVPSSTVTAFRGQFDWLQDRKMVLYAGTIGIANEVEYLVHVAKEMLELDSEVRFVVIGTGGRKDNVILEAHANGTLNRNVFVLDPMPKEDVAAAFAAADISMVLFRDVVELWTNSANKFFDSLAAGTPVAVNNVGWQAEALAKHDAGFDLHPHDHAGAAAKLLRHASDDVWLRDAGRSARALARSEYDRDALAQRLERVLLDTSGGDHEAHEVRGGQPRSEL